MLTAEAESQIYTSNLAILYKSFTLDDTMAGVCKKQYFTAKILIIT